MAPFRVTSQRWLLSLPSETSPSSRYLVSPSIPLKLLPSKELLGILPLPTGQNAKMMNLYPLQNSSCAGIFRKHEADLFCCFIENIGVGLAYHAKIYRVLRAIEIVAANNWNNLWLETDSTLVVLAFKSSSLTWNLRNRWFNYKILISNMNFVVSHVYI